VEVKSVELRNLRFIGKPNSKIIADANEVRRSLINKNVKTVDARSKREFNGSYVTASRRRHPFGNKY
jgi:3-mercaptopyruvate sulfurtransferase SseA